MKKLLALGHSFNSSELFLNFPIKKLKMTLKLCSDILSRNRRRLTAANIFIRSVEMVIDDIIENNTLFKFPTLGRTQAYLQINRTTGDDFKNAFKKGKWRDVDFIKSNFSGYLLYLILYSLKRTMREKPVYLSKNKSNKLTEKTNEGKQY